MNNAEWYTINCETRTEFKSSMCNFGHMILLMPQFLIYKMEIMSTTWVVIKFSKWNLESSYVVNPAMCHLDSLSVKYQLPQLLGEEAAFSCQPLWHCCSCREVHGLKLNPILGWSPSGDWWMQEYQDTPISDHSRAIQMLEHHWCLLSLRHSFPSPTALLVPFSLL